MMHLLRELLFYRPRADTNSEGVRDYRTKIQGKRGYKPSNEEWLPIATTNNDQNMNRFEGKLNVSLGLNKFLYALQGTKNSIRFDLLSKTIASHAIKSFATSR
mmetsp:Transcript_8213/g.20227  ORF Transcript_8213/g.20227 Transcript_8213/m.20227 type:complete len:103 (-) Transcript_8213:1489-1797(-)